MSLRNTTSEISVNVLAGECNLEHTAQTEFLLSFFHCIDEVIEVCIDNYVLDPSSLIYQRADSSSTQKLLLLFEEQEPETFLRPRCRLGIIKKKVRHPFAFRKWDMAKPTYPNSKADQFHLSLGCRNRDLPRADSKSEVWFGGSNKRNMHDHPSNEVVF